MNQKNVDALAAILAEQPLDDADYSPGQPIMLSADKWARLLASRGVLMPSALTPSDLRRVIAIGMPPNPNAPGYEPLHAFFTGELERIAKGEGA